MTTEPTYAEFSARDQAFGSEVLAITKGVELPFKISRLPVKRTLIHVFHTEWNHGVGFEIELYLAPPRKGRPWWSLWTQVHESNSDYPSGRLYPGVATGYLEALKDDDINNVAKYMCTQLMRLDGCPIESQREGLLSALDYYSIILSSFESGKTGDCELNVDFLAKYREALASSALPEMRGIVSERIEHYLKEYKHSLQ